MTDLVSHGMWHGKVATVYESGFIIDLESEDGIVAVDKLVPGIKAGMAVTIYTTGEVDEHGHAVVDFEFVDGKELPN